MAQTEAVRQYKTRSAKVLPFCAFYFLRMGRAHIIRKTVDVTIK